MLVYLYIYAAVQVLGCACCSCPGSTITYTCTAPGGDSTVWQGSAFHCIGNRISLLHVQRISNHTFSCNDGRIFGYIFTIDLEKNLYSSVLTVTALSENLHNKTVQCLYSNGTDLIPISKYIIQIQLGKWTIIVVSCTIVYNTKKNRTTSST